MLRWNRDRKIARSQRALRCSVPKLINYDKKYKLIKANRFRSDLCVLLPECTRLVRFSRFRMKMSGNSLPDPNYRTDFLLSQKMSPIPWFCKDTKKWNENNPINNEILSAIFFMPSGLRFCIDWPLYTKQYSEVQSTSAITELLVTKTRLSTLQ